MKREVVINGMLPQPTAEQIQRARVRAGHTQTQMSQFIGLTGQSRISEYENGHVTMSSRTWTLYLLLTDQHPRLKLVKRGT